MHIPWAVLQVCGPFSSQGTKREERGESIAEMCFPNVGALCTRQAVRTFFLGKHASMLESFVGDLKLCKTCHFPKFTDATMF